MELFLRFNHIKKTKAVIISVPSCLWLSNIIASEFEAPCYCSKRRPGVLSTSSTGKYAGQTISHLRYNIELVFMRILQNSNTFTPLPPRSKKTTKLLILSQSITVILSASFSIFKKNLLLSKRENSAAIFLVFLRVNRIAQRAYYRFLHCCYRFVHCCYRFCTVVTDFCTLLGDVWD